MLDISEYRKVLGILEDFVVDREYPYDFKTADSIIAPNSPVLTSENHTLHSNSVLVTSLRAYDEIKVKLDVPVNLRSDQFTTIEIKFFSDTDIDLSNISLGLSESENSPAIKYFEYETTDVNVEAGNHGILFFDLGNNKQSFSNINAFILKIEQAINQFFITDIVIKHNNHVVTLERIENAINTAQNDIKIELNADSIPAKLNHLIYKLASAQIWLSKWEHDGKTMNEGKETPNYGSRLYTQVLNAIDKYLNPPKDESSSTDTKETINTTLVGSSTVDW